METQTIYLIRHGATKSNAENIFTGLKTDDPLSEKGREQARKLAAFLKKEAGDVATIYTSPMMRAMETMAIIADAISKPARKGPDGQHLPKMIIEPKLHEIDHGAWDGMTADKVGKIWPRELELWQNGDQNLVEFPCGETIMRARTRVWSGFQSILSANREEKIIISAHGGANALILTNILKTDFFRPIRQFNACLNIIERNLESRKDDFKIILMNSSTHLR